MTEKGKRTESVIVCQVYANKKQNMDDVSLHRFSVVTGKLKLFHVDKR
jgi:hypothetical protein